jgi:outer membrane biosynthesis protein TonB
MVTRSKPVMAIRKQASPMMLEDVSPAQLMEVSDQQEEKEGEISQTGGHSHGGTGSQPLLVSYLNDIHKRIKRAWVPPQGETRSARILFRIKKNGRLSSIKLVDSSGLFSSDQSAMHAIVASAPFKVLPAEYPAEFLDLLYTFNYTRDEISEADTTQTF